MDERMEAHNNADYAILVCKDVIERFQRLAIRCNQFLYEVENRSANTPDRSDTTQSGLILKLHATAKDVLDFLLKFDLGDVTKLLNTTREDLPPDFLFSALQILNDSVIPELDPTNIPENIEDRENLIKELASFATAMREHITTSHNKEGVDFALEQMAPDSASMVHAGFHYILPNGLRAIEADMTNVLAGKMALTIQNIANKASRLINIDHLSLLSPEHPDNPMNDMQRIGKRDKYGVTWTGLHTSAASLFTLLKKDTQREAILDFFAQQCADVDDYCQTDPQFEGFSVRHAIEELIGLVESHLDDIVDPNSRHATLVPTDTAEYYLWQLNLQQFSEAFREKFSQMVDVFKASGTRHNVFPGFVPLGNITIEIQSRFL
jgi:hypothetical protein